MRSVSVFENKKVLVLGLARSGVSAAKLLAKLHAMVTVNDALPFEENLGAQELLDEGIRVICGSHPIELMDEAFEYIVKNPGIPYTNPIVVRAKEKKVPILTEVELAYLVSEAEIIGITGTNGKTTTTTMIGELLNTRKNQSKAHLCGNIGFPASSVAQKANTRDSLVMELSSFQLMGIETFRPKIAVITNLFSAHLDYHGTREEYVDAKWCIQENMTEDDILILNDKQEELHALAKTSRAKILYFAGGKKATGAYEIEGNIHYQDEFIMRADEINVPGAHNLENALAAITVAKLRGVANEDIQTVLKNFSGVAHRTQFVTEICGRKFYNDSKATNILATQMALSGFDNEKVILLAGGLDRGNGFEELHASIEGLKGMVVFGETKEKMANLAKKAGVAHIICTENVESAVAEAYSLSEVGDVVLLSPANASWDQYKNFERRGEAFVEQVQQLKKELEK